MNTVHRMASALPNTAGPPQGLPGAQCYSGGLGPMGQGPQAPHGPQWVLTHTVAALPSTEWTVPCAEPGGGGVGPPYPPHLLPSHHTRLPSRVPPSFPFFSYLPFLPPLLWLLFLPCVQAAPCCGLAVCTPPVSPLSAGTPPPLSAAPASSRLCLLGLAGVTLEQEKGDAQGAPGHLGERSGPARGDATCLIFKGRRPRWV